MLKINYNPSLYVFTCNIPSEIEITTDAASVYVTIACGPDTIFETTLYPYNNIAMLYDARSIIEGHMWISSVSSPTLSSRRTQRLKRRPHQSAISFTLV